MGLWARWRRAMKALEAKRKVAEGKAPEPEYDPQEQKKKRYFAQFDRRAYDRFGRPVRHVIVTDIAIPFWSMVSLLVELVLAAIPAAVILGLLYVAMKWLWILLLTLAPVRH